MLWDKYIARTDARHSEQMFGENMQLMDLNLASMLNLSAASGHSSGQVLHGSVGAMSPQVQIWNWQLPGSTSDVKNQMNPVLGPIAAGPEESLFGIPGSNQGGNNLTSKGLPPIGLDQLPSGILQQQKSYMLGPDPFNQLQMSTPQQLMLAQQNLTSPSASDLESRSLRMLMNNRIMNLGIDGLTNAVGDTVSNVGSLLQAGSSDLSCGNDPEMLLKAQYNQRHHNQQQNDNPQQLQLHNTFSAQQSRSLNYNLHQQDRSLGGGDIPVDGSMSNSVRGSKQPLKNLRGRKRKQRVSSSGPANSTGTANTTGPSPSPASSTPSTHTPNDVISGLPHTGGSSKPLMMFGSDGAGSLASRSNMLWDDKNFALPDADFFNEDGSLDNDDADCRDPVGRCVDVDKVSGFTFTEVNAIRASGNIVVCCHFSSDGKLLASGGHDKKVVLWHVDSLKQKRVLEEHLGLITDVRFSSGLPRLATSSFDKTVKVWDAENPGYSLQTFTGHSSSVMSLDFHPIKEDLICSCDGDGELRYWSINFGSCARVFKGGAGHMRFQPRLGRYLAAANENVVFIFDVETQARQHLLQGHTKPIHSVCWHPTGDYLASLSEDTVRVWSFTAGSEGTCIHNLSGNGKKFKTCVFHPTCSPPLLVIGCYRSLDVWNMTQKKTMIVSADEGLIADLAASTVNGLVASASHNKIVKLWK